jgi:hypothetical protein
MNIVLKFEDTVSVKTKSEQQMVWDGAAEQGWSDRVWTEATQGKDLASVCVLCPRCGIGCPYFKREGQR